MHTQFLTTLFLFVWSVSFTSAPRSQNNHDVRPRAMFVNKSADGLEIKILKKTGEVFEPVASTHEFKAGDEVRIVFRSNCDGYVYFVNVAPSGETRVIHSSAVTTEKENELPTGEDVFHFDQEEGVEVLKIVLARERIPVFEEALKNADGYLGKSPASVAQELTRSLPPPSGKKPDPKVEHVNIAPPDNSPGARCRGLKLASSDQFRCRGIALAQGNSQTKQGMVVIAIPDDPKEKNADGKLKSGDVVVIELRLKHRQ